MEPKPGYKSTEFWLAAATTVIAALLASGAFEESSMFAKVLTLAASVLASLGYTAARAFTKVGTAKAAALAEAAKANPPPA